MPPLDEGSVSRALEEHGAPGDWVIDPFGASPQLVMEAAQAQRAVWVAANNPVTRFILQHTLKPFPLADLQAALARLAAAPKDGTRLEPFILDLYQSECVRCGAQVVVDSYIWDREIEGPALKVYVCERCNFVGEAATSEADWERASSYTRRGLQHALALEQVAPAGDPDRRHAEAALSVYPGRAFYALVTILNKLEQLELSPDLNSAAHALLLTAFDASNALWSYPEGRSRPRQLRASARYREDNVWRAFERAVTVWSMDDPGLEVSAWSADAQPEPGQVVIFAGPIRDLVAQLPAGVPRCLLSVLPRPNQAFWTLSALWAAWLWGRVAAAPIKAALRRRRYDWAWHASALRTVLSRLTPIMDPEAEILAFVPEAEPGFNAAALAGFDGAGFQLHGCALRLAEGQAFYSFSLAKDDGPRFPEAEIQRQMALAAESVLRARGEPAPYALLHAAAWCSLAQQRQYDPLWEEEETPLTTMIGEIFERVLADRRIFIRLGEFVEPESGLYWLADPKSCDVPLSDRVETLVLTYLQEGDGRTLLDVDNRVCAALPGLLTPDRRLVQACLSSYAQEEERMGNWRLRSEDEPETRNADCEEIRHLLIELGQRLGFKVRDEDAIRWLDQEDQTIYDFCVVETASLGAALEHGEEHSLIFVLPGGRAALVAEKARRDPRLRDWLRKGVGVIKFRHVRRLVSEIGLNRDNLAARLGIDPPEHHDPQLPLL
jgi:hypothetical protein